MLTGPSRRGGGWTWMGQLLPHGPRLEFESVPTSLVSDPGLSLHATSGGPKTVLNSLPLSLSSAGITLMSL